MQLVSVDYEDKALDISRTAGGTLVIECTSEDGRETVEVEPAELAELVGVDGRKETGPHRPPGDWTGVFIRGDDAFGYAQLLRQAEAALDALDTRTARWIQGRLQAFRHLLESSDESQLTRDNG